MFCLNFGNDAKHWPLVFFADFNSLGLKLSIATKTIFLGPITEVLECFNWSRSRSRHVVMFGTPRKWIKDSRFDPKIQMALTSSISKLFWWFFHWRHLFQSQNDLPVSKIGLEAKQNYVFFTAIYPANLPKVKQKYPDLLVHFWEIGSFHKAIFEISVCAILRNRVVKIPGQPRKFVH